MRETKTDRAENEIKNLYPVTDGREFVKKISTMCYSSELEELTVEEIF